MNDDEIDETNMVPLSLRSPEFADTAGEQDTAKPGFEKNHERNEDSLTPDSRVFIEHARSSPDWRKRENSRITLSSQSSPQRGPRQRIGSRNRTRTNTGSSNDVFDPFEESERHVNPKAELIQNEFKKKLYLLLEDPSSSRAALYTTLFISFNIILSTIVATVETMPSLYSDEKGIWMAREALEIFIVICFTLEFIFRVIAHSDTWGSLMNLAKSPLSWIDLLAIVPYFIELAVDRNNSAAHLSYVFRITILRMFRLFRIFRVFKHSSLIQLSIEVLIVALKKSLDALWALFFFAIITILLFSTLIYFAERGTYDPEKKVFVTKNGVPSIFDSIPSSFWFVIVTITTTGYGDMVPQTFVGKFLAFPAMMCGVLLIALPSIIVGRNFTVVWEHMKTHRIRMAGGEEPSDYHHSQPTSPVEDYFQQNGGYFPVTETTAYQHPTSNSRQPSFSTTRPILQDPPFTSPLTDPQFSSHPLSSSSNIPSDPKLLINHIQKLLIQTQAQQVALCNALKALQNHFEDLGNDTEALNYKIGSHPLQ